MGDGETLKRSLFLSDVRYGKMGHLWFTAYQLCDDLRPMRPTTLYDIITTSQHCLN